MISTNATPEKGALATCTECGLAAPAPIVVTTAVRRLANNEKRFGRCANRKACARRQLRAANKGKADEARPS